MKTAKYRFDSSTGAVYAFDTSLDAYLFIGNLNGRTMRKFVQAYEARPDNDDTYHWQQLGN